jgi:SAM-dependent methyltransferase
MNTTRCADLKAPIGGIRCCERKWRAICPVASGRASRAGLSLDVLYHKDVAEERSVSEMARVMKPGGYFILNLPAFDVLRGRHDVAVHGARRYTIKRVRKLLEPVGLKTEAIFYWNAWLFVPVLVWRLLTRLGRPREEVGTKGDLSQFPPQINALLTHLGRLDFAACRRLRPPLGTSVYTVARKL